MEKDVFMDIWLLYFWFPQHLEEEEKKYGVEYLPLDKLAEVCDIVSIHVAVTPETVGMINRGFLSKMKYGVDRIKQRC